LPQPEQLQEPLEQEQLVAALPHDLRQQTEHISPMAEPRQPRRSRTRRMRSKCRPLVEISRDLGGARRAVRTEGW
jgi:hypothetical protein